jgi:hypothetical protein
MRAVRLGQGLAAAVMLSVMLLVSGMLGLGVAIQRGALAPGKLDVRLGRMHLVTYETYTPECPPYPTSCPLGLSEFPAQDFYVIWVLRLAGRRDQPGGIYESGTRILTLPLYQP